MPIKLFGEPLKPFPRFLRTCALTFIFNVATQFALGDAHCPARGDDRAAERFILSNARLLDVDYGASRYVPWSAIDSHRLPSCVYVTPVSVRWW